METEDIIELGSSDEEPGPPPPKKIKVRNAMVHIPTKFHGVTIKPIKPNSTALPKLGKNITVTKTTGSPSSTLSNKVKPPDKQTQKLGATKKKTLAKKPIQTNQTKGRVFNPLSQIKKGIVGQSVGNSTIIGLKNPIVIKKPQINKPQPLQRLPPSITIKKTGTAIKRVPNIITLPKTAQQVTNLTKKRKIEMLQTVEVDDEEAPTSSNNPQWYLRPEDQSGSSNQEDKAGTPKDNAIAEENAISMHEDANNTEPEGPKFIEITIEDSPIKPAKTKRTRELSTEKVITIDDSPNKGGVISVDVAEGSDTEASTVKKIPHSKKKLNYPPELQSIEEMHTVEIEIEPMETHALNFEVNNENKVISLTPDIMEVERTSVEISQNKQGAVSVVHTNPDQSKENSKAVPKSEATIKSEFHPIYQRFIDLCLKLENSSDMEKIVEKKIKTYYRQVPKEYTESDEFLDLVSSKIMAMEAAPEKMYLYIKDVVDELNLQRKYMKQAPVEGNQSKDQDSYVYGKENELDPNKQRQIRKLEKTLKKLNRAIQKLENQEVDFDDEEDSVYLLTEKYKERMVRVHAKFCQLTNTKMPSQPRLIIDARPGLSAAPAKRLEAWINKKDEVVFPDFHDVLRCVREANEIENLGWNEACIMEEARDLFVRCGRKLQRRRQENEWRLATSRITANSDPAEQSDELKKQLEVNRRLANTKESEVFNKFCDRQSQLKLEAEEIDDKEAEESPVESEEEDNDEISSLESKQRRKERLRRLLQEQSKKNIPNKGPQTEQVVNNEIEIVKEPVESISVNKSEIVNEEDKIQSLSDDSNEIGSDMDELHLLQKLHSDSEIRTVSTSDSDSETPIAISDTLDSSSDDEKQTKQPIDVISIENSSYSDESDSQKNEIKNNKKCTVSSKESIEESKKNECTSSVENTVLTSSDDENNSIKSVISENCDNLAKISSEKEARAHDKDFEHSLVSESAELCINVNDFAKTSDAEDEQSTNSDIIDNPGSSTSSGQYEELLKEHNSDPLLKEPELIPTDPSDKLFDSLVIKHYNDPLVKKHLKGSDSSNGDDHDNSNSDSQSTNAPETAEEAKKDLIESSVDTEELLNSNSPSMQIVDKFIEKLKQSEGSQSSDDLFMSVDQELGLNPEASSPVTLALQKEVNLARQTKAWPRFKDECSSLSSAEDDNTVDKSESMLKKSNESTNIDFDGMDIANPAATGVKDTKAWNYASSKYDDVTQSDIASTKTKGARACSSKDLSEGIDTANCEANAEESKDADVSGSVSPKNVCKAIDIAEVVTDHTETKDVDISSSEQRKNKTECDELSFKPHEVAKENSGETENTLMEIFDTNYEPEDVHDNESDLISNGNLNINMDISELPYSDTHFSQKNDGGDKDLDDLNKHLSAEEDECADKEAIPRTVTSMCLDTTEGND